MSGSSPTIERRRFWHRAAVERDGASFIVVLDEKPVRMPNGDTLRTAFRPLAEALAAEWRAVGGGAIGSPFGPASLPLTALAATLQERVAPDPEQARVLLLPFIHNELLCYRADASDVLATSQEKEWQPWLDWCERRYGVSLRTSTGVMPARQSPETVSAMRAVLAARSVAALVALGVLVPALGSLVLGLAVTDGTLPAEDALRFSLLEELEQQRRWGLDREADVRQARLRAETTDAARFLVLCREDADER